MNKTSRLLTLLMLLLVSIGTSWAGTVNIPTTFGSYITTSESTTTGNINNNDNGDLGGIYNGSSATFTLANPTSKDMVLAFKMGRGTTGGDPKVKVTLNNGTSDVFTTTVDFITTSSWTPSDLHVFDLGRVAAGTYTLKFEFSTGSSYVGNLGSIGLYAGNTYYPIPGDIDLNSGSYTTASVEGAGNVGYVSNGASASYTVYNNVAGTATLNMGIVRYGDGDVTVTVTDLATGTVEQTKQFTTTSDICKGYDTPTAIELGTLTKGLKTIKLDFAAASGFICNYKNVSVSVVADDPDPSGASYTFGITRDAADGEVTSNNYMLSPDCEDVTTSSLLSTYGTLGTGYKFYNGTSTQLTFGEKATQSYRNSANSATIKTQAGDADGAEKHDAYVGFDLNIEKGKQLQITNIASLIYPGEKSNYGYEYIIEDANGVQLYKSNTFNVGNPQSTVGSNSINTSAVEALSGLTGKVHVKFLWWCNSSSTVIILKDFNVTATVTDAPASYYNVTYSLGESGATGTTPAAIYEASTLSQYSAPANTTIYKEGYTLTAWTDGANEYLIGQAYDMQEKTYNLTPVLTANPVSLSEVKKDLVVTWKFGKGNGAPIFDGSAQNYVKQVSLNGTTTDLAVQMGGGKNDDRNDEWMNNQLKNMTVPVCPGAVVTAKVYYANDAVINGETFTYNEAVNGPVGNVIYTYTCPEGVGSTIDINVGNQFLSYIEVTYPGTNIITFEDFAVNFKVNPYVVTLPANGELPECVNISGSYHNDHGYTGAIATVKVDGPVKISVGGCNFTNQATVKDGSTLIATLGTRGAGCNGVAVAYYNGPKTTLTISCGTYCPSLKVEAVNAEDIPALYTVNYYNGTDLVSTAEVYDGTGLGTLPGAPAVAAGKHFRGWYTSCDANGVKATGATVITGNTNFYAYIMDVDTQNGYYVPSNNGTAAENGQSLLNLIEYCGENASSSVQKIYVPNGNYDFGTACRTEVKSNIVILGESREGVKIENHPTAPGIQATSTLRITGDNVYLQNLTLRCDVSYSTSSTHGVGVALEINGNKSICNNVDLQCNQDTYYSNGSSDQVGYFKGGRIEGTVDYICGGGNMWFEGTTLYNNQRWDAGKGQHTTTGDVIAAPSTAAATQYGYVMNNCIIDGADCQNNNYNLARPWQGSPAATWLNTTFVKMPSAKGYGKMGEGMVLRFHEYNSHDANGNAVTGHVLTDSQPAAGSDAIYLASVGNYTYANVLGGWDPEAVIALYSATPSINAMGFGTFSAPFDAQITGAKVYKATYNEAEQVIVCTEIESGKVPAGTGVILYSEGATEASTANAFATISADAVEGNDLKATTLADGTLATKETSLVLSGKTFMNYTGATFAAGKAYLPYATAAKSITIIFADDATATIAVKDNAANGAVRKTIANGKITIITPNGIYTPAGAKMK